jgi:hypothetical protein
MDGLCLLKRFGSYFTIVGVSVVTYLPAVNNFFISDDFTLLSYLTALKQDPLYIIEAPSEFFRLVSYIYFWLCSSIFGLNSAGYYWSGIALHALASLLVFALVTRLTAEPVAGWAAALFFSAYERHQEAVMWISAVNETILAVNCLVFLLLWERFTPTTRRVACVAFALALFSKEAAVALLPLAVLLLRLKGFTWRAAFKESLPLTAITAGYVYLWLSRASGNFFVTDHYYALGFHFLPVYARSVVRLLAPAVPFLLAGLVLRRMVDVRGLFRDRRFLFFAALVLLTTIPYSFLTYLPSIPSRNTYLPSAGLAGMLGMMFVLVYRAVSAQRAKAFVAVMFTTTIAANAGYVWMKKEPQYLGRAAPTLELIHAFNALDENVGLESSFCVADFPLHYWIGTESVRWFTRFTTSSIEFSSSCDPAKTDVVFRWTNDARIVLVPGNLASDAPKSDP